jgi:hypothetical protein
MGGGQQKQMRIDLPDLPQRGQDASLIMLHAEVLQGHVIGNVVVRVDAARVIAGTDAATAHIQIQS